MSEYVRHVTELDRPPVPRLSHLDVELTERCDNDCIHCCINLPTGDRAARAREMSTDQVKDVLKQAADLGCLQVRLTGGEPLLRRDFKDLYLFARRLGMKVMIFTNARRIDHELADLLARVPPLIPLEVTVYGMHQQSYEAVTRAPGSFAQFWHGVSLLLDRGVPFVVKGALLPPNRAEIEEFEAWARTLPGMDKQPSYAMFFDLRHRRDDPAKNRLIASLRLPPEEGVAILARNDAEYRKEMREFAARFMSPTGTRLFSCGAGRSICIDPYGRAQPCMGLRAPEFTLDALTSSLSDILSAFQPMLDVRAANQAYLERCAVCSLKGLCEQCPAKSWTEHGTLDTPVEFLCEVAHAQARYLRWLGECEKGWKAKVSPESAD